MESTSSHHHFDFSRVLLTADDWGLSPGVNQGILRLAKRGVIRRVSIMAEEKFLTTELEALREIPNIQLGLHFNLTYRKRFSGPSELLRAWIFSMGTKRKELRCWVMAELRSQLKTLKRHIGRVDHFDGHHHVHILPGLIDMAADSLREFGVSSIRIPYDRRQYFSKKAPIAFFAGMLKRSSRARDFESPIFAYPSSATFKDPKKLKEYLGRNLGREILTHPAYENDFEKYGIGDRMAEARVKEFETLQSLIIN